MNAGIIINPLVSALAGWLFSWVILKVMFRRLRKRQSQFSAIIANVISRKIISSEEIEIIILDPGTLKKITPVIETHIDYFLRVKLKDAMPMVAMFVGDKTITQLKEVFMTEMETLFPEIMKNYLKELYTDMDIEAKITSALASLPASKIESFISQTFNKELCYVQFAATLLGFAIGAFQTIIFLLIKS